MVSACGLRSDRTASKIIHDLSLTGSGLTMWLPRDNAVKVTQIPNAHLALRQEFQTNSSYNVVSTMRSALGDSTYVRRVQPGGHSLVRSAEKNSHS